jgi:RNA polymerase sigma-70 factor (ECF subfamily)
VAKNELVAVAADAFRQRAHQMMARYPHLRRFEETSDVLQLALLRLHHTIGRVKIDSAKHFYALVTLQIRRTLLDLSRRYYGVFGHGRQLSNASEGNRMAEEVGEVGTSYWKMHDWSLFHEAVAELDPIYREPFEIIWYHEKKASDLAEILGVTQQTIRRRYHRACQLIRERIE